MIIRFEAPSPWRERGVHLLELVPEAIVEAEPPSWNLEVKVEVRGQILLLTAKAGRQRDRAIVPAASADFQRALFRLLGKITDSDPSPWGILTGVRPGKVAARLLQNLNREETIVRLREHYLLREDKAELLVDVVGAGYPLLNRRGVSIYISVPFCPSRCHYCSFAAHSLARWQHVLPKYIEQTASELGKLLEACRAYQLPVNSIYVGGGTPTSLTPEQLAILLAPAIKPGCEFTVEAGRPDTITPRHLEVMGGLGVTRVSVNCQYPGEKTLQAIGRNHTIQEFQQALMAAQSSEISIINSDMIVGLPDQTVAGFVQALEYLVDKGVQNITIHALSLKRGAKTRQQYLTPDLAGEIALAAYQYLQERDYRPYYLYRQKNIAANLENIGFALPGTFCYYNVASIAENEPVLGVGAGAVSKLVMHNRIETLNNPADPIQYLARSQSLVRRKLDWLRHSS